MRENRVSSNAGATDEGLKGLTAPGAPRDKEPAKKEFDFEAAFKELGHRFEVGARALYPVTEEDLSKVQPMIRAALKRS